MKMTSILFLQGVFLLSSGPAWGQEILRKYMPKEVCSSISVSIANADNGQKVTDNIPICVDVTEIHKLDQLTCYGGDSNISCANNNKEGKVKVTTEKYEFNTFAYSSFEAFGKIIDGKEAVSETTLTKVRTNWAFRMNSILSAYSHSFSIPLSTIVLPANIENFELVVRYQSDNWPRPRHSANEERSNQLDNTIYAIGYDNAGTEYEVAIGNTDAYLTFQ
ncbi:MAG: hypothetical protein AB7T49_19295 [Oligoflexales bacterium]